MRKQVTILLVFSLLLVWIPKMTITSAAETETGVTWEVVDGVLTVQGDGEIPSGAFENDTSIKKAVIQNGITYVGANSFNGCSALKSISLADSISEIGENAFANTGLKELTLPKQLQVMQAGILSGTSGVTKLVIPKSVTDMYGKNMWGYGALRGSNVEYLEFEDGINKIPKGAALADTALKEVIIPDSVTLIEDEAFHGCTSLNSVSLPASITAIGGNAFADTGLTSLKLPEKLEIIGSSFLSGTAGVTRLFIPKTVTDMYGKNMWGYGALRGSNVEYLEFEDGINKIPKGAAMADTALKEVVIPDSVTSIEPETFHGCKALKSISLPDGITQIGINAFADTGLEALVLPKQLQLIRANFLAGTKGVTRLTIPKTVTDMYGNDMWSKGALRESSVEVLEFEDGSRQIPRGAAMADTALKEVVIPESITSIGADAFNGCSSLRTVAIPDAVTSIGANAFNGCTNLHSIYLSENAIDIGSKSIPSDVTVFTDNCSNAAIYAIDNGNPFYIVKEFNDSDDFVIDRNESDYTVNVNSAAVNGFYKLDIKYAVKSQWEDRLSGLKIVVRIPQSADGTTPIYVYHNGERVENYTYNTFQRKATIPVDDKTGEICITAKVPEDNKLVSYALLTGTKEKKSFSEVVGIINEQLNGLSVEVPETVHDPRFVIRGTAPSFHDIKAYIDGEAIGTATSTKAGTWSMEAVIPEAESGVNYNLKVTCSGSEENSEKNIALFYDESSPIITECIMNYTEHKVHKAVDLIKTDGTKPTVFFEPGTPFDFTIKIDNDENIDKVFVTSTRNNQKRYLEALYDQDTDTYKTNGNFSDNPRYVPGIIGVEYVSKPKELLADQKYPYLTKTMQEYTSRVESASTVLQNDEHNYHLLLNLNKLMNNQGADISESTVDFYASVYDAAFDGNLSDWMDVEKGFVKFVLKTEAGEDVEYFFPDEKEYEGADRIVYYVHEVSSNTYVKMILDNLSEENPDSTLLLNLNTVLSPVGKITKMYLKQQSINSDMDALRDEVMSNPYLSSAEKTESLKRVEALRNDEMMFTVLTTVMPLVLSAAIVTSGGFAVPYAMFSGMLSMMGSVAPFFWEQRETMIKQGKYASPPPDIPWEQIKQFVLKWVVDPSGYVYDAKTKEPLLGVEATAYCIEDDGSAGFWDNKPAEGEEGKIWDANEYEQFNPIITSESGKYAWDVPEGWWRVKFEKEGYQTAWSDWMTVPPIQTEVNVGMYKETEYDAIATLKSHALSLTGDIGIIYNLYLSDEALNDKGAKVVFTYSGKDQGSVPVSAGVKKTDKNGKDYYGYCCEVHSSQMTGPAVAKVVLSDGRESEEFPYTVKEYADIIIANKNNSAAYTEVTPLVKAMLNYGGYAQEFFKYDASLSLANADLTEAERDVSGVKTEDLAKYAIVREGTAPEGISYKSATLQLTSTTTIRYSFTLAEGHDISEYTFKNGNKVLKPELLSDNVYCVYINDVASDELDNMYTVSVGDFSVTYGALTYAYNQLKKDTTPDELKNLLRAMVLYNQEANEYFS